MDLPKSQNAEQTRGSAPRKIAASRALYMAQDDAGDPGRGNISSLREVLLGLGKSGHAQEDGCWCHGPRATERLPA